MIEGSLILGKEFFVKERDSAYGNWPAAFWRELIQNSVDAGARNIKARAFVERTYYTGGPTTDAMTKDMVSFSHMDVREFESRQRSELQDQEAVVLLELEDDGCGMTRDILENVYLRLGATTKTTGSVGGFGRARMLTCFAMDQYAITTADMRLEGRGARYTLSKARNYQKGCVLSASTTYPLNRVHHFYRELIRFLSLCELPNVNFSFNGAHISHGGSAVGPELLSVKAGDSVWGKIHAVNGDHPSLKYHLNVRVSGLLMFTQYIGYEPGLLLELEPNMSRSVLVSNRDGLKQPFSNIIYEIVARVAKMGLRAFDAPRPTKKKYYRNKEGYFKVVPSSGSRAAELRISDSQNLLQAYFTVKKGRGAIYDKLENSKTYSIDAFVNDVSFVVEKDCAYDVEKIDAWFPELWKFKIHGDSVVWANDCLERVRLFLAWTAAVRYVVVAATTIQKLQNDRTTLNEYYVRWTPGITLTHNTLATHHKETVEDEDVSVISFNPIEMTKNISVSQLYVTEVGLRYLLSAAMHEVVHIVKQEHDDDYASVLTYLIANVDQKEALAYIKRNIR